MSIREFYFYPKGKSQILISKNIFKILKFLKSRKLLRWNVIGDPIENRKSQKYVDHIFNRISNEKSKYFRVFFEIFKKIKILKNIFRNQNLKFCLRVKSKIRGYSYTLRIFNKSRGKIKCAKNVRESVHGFRIFKLMSYILLKSCFFWKKALFSGICFDLFDVFDDFQKHRRWHVI